MLVHDGFVVFHHMIHQIPKWLLVIFFAKVRELMYDDRVYELRTCGEIFCKPIAKTQSIFRATAPPAAFGFCDFDAGVSGQMVL